MEKNDFTPTELSPSLALRSVVCYTFHSLFTRKEKEP